MKIQGQFSRLTLYYPDEMFVIWPGVSLELSRSEFSSPPDNARGIIEIKRRRKIAVLPEADRYNIGEDSLKLLQHIMDPSDQISDLPESYLFEIYLDNKYSKVSEGNFPLEKSDLVLSAFLAHCLKEVRDRYTLPREIPQPIPSPLDRWFVPLRPIRGRQPLFKIGVTYVYSYDDAFAEVKPETTMSNILPYTLVGCLDPLELEQLYISGVNVPKRHCWFLQGKTPEWLFFRNHAKAVRKIILSGL